MVRLVTAWVSAFGVCMLLSACMTGGGASHDSGRAMTRAFEAFKAGGSVEEFAEASGQAARERAEAEGRADNAARKARSGDGGAPAAAAGDFGAAVAGGAASAPAHIVALNRQAVAARKSGQLKKALALIEKARDAAKRDMRADDPYHIALKNNHASLLVAAGQFRKAEPLYRDVRAELSKRLGERHIQVARVSNALALLLRRTGRYAQAEPLYREALAIARAEKGARHLYTLKTMNSLGAVLQATGRLQEAEKFYRRALDIKRADLGETHESTLASMTNLGALLSSTGRAEEAETLYRKVLAAQRAAFGDDHPATLRSMNNLGVHLQKRGRLAEAAPLLQTALAGARAGGSELGRDALRAAHNLGVLLMQQRKLARAEPLLDETLSGYRATFGDTHPETLTVAVNLVDVQVQRGRAGQAATVLAGVAPGALAWVQAQLSESENTGQRRRFAGDPGAFQSFAFSVALADQGVAARRLAAETALGWKRSDGADEATLARFVSGAGDAKTRALAKRLEKQRRDLATAVNSGAPDVAGRVRALERTRAELTKRSRAFGAKERERRAGLEAVKAALRSGEALLEFRVFTPADFEKRSLQPERVLGVLIRPGEEPLLKDLGSRKDIAARVKIVTDFDRERSARQRAARRLSQQLLEPFGAALRQAKRVYASPDGALNLLPFDLLPFAGETYWVAAQDVRVISTGRVLVRDRARGRTKGLLAFGGVDFDRARGASAQTVTVAAAHRRQAAAATRSGALERFAPLPASGAEIRRLAALYEAKTGEKATLHSGSQALEAVIKSARSPRVLHVASHGFFRDDHRRSRINPMTLSGLAFAGANQGLRGERLTDGEDGVLWALEAMSLSLSGTELVTLSACDTGKGVLDAGEGVYGLGRAFQIAGAENVMLTLWPLDDEQARRFMTDFYDAWLSEAQQDPAAALRATKRAWAASSDPFRADPFFWAPFALIQNGR